MKKPQESKPLIGIIAILETIVLFFMGVISNKIADALDISPFVLAVCTVMGLIVLSALIYIRFMDLSVFQVSLDRIRGAFSQYSQRRSRHIESSATQSIVANLLQRVQDESVQRDALEMFTGILVTAFTSLTLCACLYGFGGLSAGDVSPLTISFVVLSL